MPHVQQRSNQQGSNHIDLEIDAALRTKALEALLVEKGIITTDLIDAVVQKFEQDIGPLNGAKVVARAWTDPTYKTRLLKDGTAAIADMGYSAQQRADIVVLENTPTVHNVVVCTLCSCYPWVVLGLPPQLVQIVCLSVTGCAGATGCFAGIWPGATGRG